MTQNTAFKQNDDNNFIEDDATTQAQSKSTKSKKAPSAFRTISEVADELDVQQHVLRFWETKFSQVKPLKRGGGRRYYRPEDVELLKAIHHLLYTEGYTIKGVQKLLKGQGKAQVLEMLTQGSRPAPQIIPDDLETVQKPEAVSRDTTQNASMNQNQKELLKGMLHDLKGIRDILKG